MNRDPFDVQVEIAGQLQRQIIKLEAQRYALLEALKMIAGETPCFDNLMGDKDIARAAIKAVEKTK